MNISFQRFNFSNLHYDSHDDKNKKKFRNVSQSKLWVGLYVGKTSDCAGDISYIAIFEGCRCYSSGFLTSVLDGDKQQASPFALLIPVNSHHYPLQKTLSDTQARPWCGGKENIPATNQTQPHTCLFSLTKVRRGEEEVHNCINFISLLSFNEGRLQLVIECKILFRNKFSWGLEVLKVVLIIQLFPTLPRIVW